MKTTKFSSEFRKECLPWRGEATPEKRELHTHAYENCIKVARKHQPTNSWGNADKNCGKASAKKADGWQCVLFFRAVIPAWKTVSLVESFKLEGGGGWIFFGWATQTMKMKCVSVCRGGQFRRKIKKGVKPFNLVLQNYVKVHYPEITPPHPARESDGRRRWLSKHPTHSQVTWL